jgi:hypothetical protein
MATEVEVLRPGPLLLRAIAMQRDRPHDPGKEPGWGDLTPRPLCQTTRAEYPEPRTCLAFAEDQICHLGHPANCRWLIESSVAAAEDGESG